MSNASAAATVWNAPNYVGELFLVGQNQTPFLNTIGGLDAGNAAKVVNSWEFAVDQNWSLETPAQPAITETASLTAPTAVTYVRAQDTNTCQIFQKQVSVSYSKQSNTGTVAGLSILGDTQPVMDEVTFQRMGALKQIAVDVEKTFLEGAYQQATNAATAAKTRGIMTAISTNAVAGGSARLTKDMINAALLKMADAGAPFTDVWIFANAFQLQMISNIYGYQPQDRTVGGVAIKQIATDFGNITVKYCPGLTNTTLGIFDMSVVKPVFLPVPGKGYLFYEPLAKTGAGESGQLYGQIGLAYGPEEFHAKITGLAIA